MDMADMKGPLTVLPNSLMLMGGMHNDSPMPAQWLKSHSTRYVIKLDRAGAYTISSKTKSTKINTVTVAISQAMTARTRCQRSASRWSVKLISLSSRAALLLNVLKKAFLAEAVGSTFLYWTSKIHASSLIRICHVFNRGKMHAVTN